MLKIINSIKGICATEGVLFRNEDLERIYQINELKKNAERNAQKIVHSARVDAEHIREAALSAGYHQGFQVALRDIIEYINNNEELIQQVRKEITEDIRQFLLALCSKTDMMLACFNDWLQRVEDNKTGLHIILPEQYQSEELKIVNVISTSWLGEFEIEYDREQSKAILFCGNSVVEFNPPEYVQNIVDYLSSKYDIELNSELAGIAEKITTKIAEKMEIL